MAKKEHASFYRCLLNYTKTSLTGHPFIALEPNQKSKKIKSTEIWVTAYHNFRGCRVIHSFVHEIQ